MPKILGANLDLSIQKETNRVQVAAQWHVLDQKFSFAHALFWGLALKPLRLHLYIQLEYSQKVGKHSVTLRGCFWFIIAKLFSKQPVLPKRRR